MKRNKPKTSHNYCPLKQEKLVQTMWISNPWLCICHTTISIYFNLKFNWDQDPNHKTLQASEHSATACLLLLSTHVFPPPRLVISIPKIPRHPSQHKSELFKQQIRVRTVTYATTYNLTPPHGTQLTPQPKELVPQPNHHGTPTPIHTCAHCFHEIPMRAATLCTVFYLS